MANNSSPQHVVSARRLVPLGLLAAAWIAFMLAGGYRYLTFAALARNRDWLCHLVQHWGVLAALVYVAIYGALVALSVPGAAVLTIAGGFLFGTWIGAPCAVVGATLGATALFLAARSGLGGLTQRAGRFVGRLEAGFRADAAARSEEPDLAIVFKPAVLLPLIGLAVLALLPVGYKRWRDKGTR